LTPIWTDGHFSSGHEFIGEGRLPVELPAPRLVALGALREQIGELEALVLLEHPQAHVENPVEVLVAQLQFAQRSHDDVHGVGRGHDLALQILLGAQGGAHVLLLELVRQFLEDLVFDQFRHDLLEELAQLAALEAVLDGVGDVRKDGLFEIVEQGLPEQGFPVDHQFIVVVRYHQGHDGHVVGVGRDAFDLDHGQGAETLDGAHGLEPLEEAEKAVGDLF
jgi:hypothetical protein